MTHIEKINKIIEQIKNNSTTKNPFVFTKKSVSHVVPDLAENKKQTTEIFIGDLTDILEVDFQNQTCTAEAGVSFCDLVDKTLPLGLMPYVVPELKTITIGGAVSGCSIEAMSYRYGGFHHSAIEYEYIDARGEIKTCSPEKDADVFEMLHGSYGTIGILTKIKFKLYPAKPFVKMTYPKFHNFNDFWNFLQERCRLGDYTFVDAIIYDKNNFIVCLGELVDTAPYTSHYDWLEIFYKSTLTKNEDYLTTKDYFYRYDAECHWITRTVPILENKIFRFFFGKIYLGSTNLIKISKKLAAILRKKKRPDVVVDVFVPSQNFPKFYDWYEKDFNFFPLWIVPYRTPQIYPWINPNHAAKTNEKFYIDCAVYGRPNCEEKVDYSELIENKVFELGGMKTLISRNHYSEQRFWEIYNQPAYMAIKRKTDPDNRLGTIYENRVKK